MLWVWMLSLLSGPFVMIMAVLPDMPVSVDQFVAGMSALYVVNAVVDVPVIVVGFLYMANFLMLIWAPSIALRVMKLARSGS